MSSSNKQKLCEKKIKTAEFKIAKILTKIDNFKLSNSYISRLGVKKETHVLEGKFRLTYTRRCLLFVTSIIAIFGTCWWIYDELSTKSCLLEMPSASKALFRPPEDCSMCVDVRDVTRVANVTPAEFEDLYAYTATPVIVTDAATDWRATKDFNYDFFSNFYKNGKMGKQVNDCFFFAYKSGLKSLQEVFTMPASRANLSGEPWYVGWSTCYDEETRHLRAYYNRPYFLPRTAESDMVDWIFMGGPGQGAHMHVDSVKHMSWQAQIRGHKRWHLAPPPECIYVCGGLNFVVTPGDILVVDTNRWYHKTEVLPGDISITIGAEYD